MSIDANWEICRFFDSIHLTMFLSGQMGNPNKIREIQIKISEIQTKKQLVSEIQI
jgi:hypothetical protein